VPIEPINPEDPKGITPPAEYLRQTGNVPYIPSNFSKPPAADEVTPDLVEEPEEEPVKGIKAGIPALSYKQPTESDPIPFDVDTYAQESFRSVAPEEVPDKLNDFARTLKYFVDPFFKQGYNATAALNRGVAGFYTHLDSIADYIELSSGVKSEGLFEKLAEMAEKDAERWAEAAEDIGGLGFMDTMISEAVGGFVPGVTQFVVDVASGFTFPYMAGASRAYKEGEQPFVAGMQAAAKTFMLDRLFRMMHPMQQYLKAPATGTIFGLEEMEAAPEGEKVAGFAKGFGTGVAYSLTSPGGRMGLNEVKEATKLMYNDFKRANKDIGEGGGWEGRKRFARGKTKYRTADEKKKSQDYAKEVEAEAGDPFKKGKPPAGETPEASVIGQAEVNSPSQLTPLLHNSKSKNLKSQAFFDKNEIKHVDLKTAVERKYITKDEGRLIDGIMEVFPDAYKEHFEPRFSDQEFMPTPEQLQAHGVKPSEAGKYEISGVLLDQKMGELKTDAKHLAVMFKNADVGTFIHEFGEFAHKRLLSPTDVKNIVKPAYLKSGSKKFRNEWFSDTFANWWFKDGAGKVIPKKLAAVFRKMQRGLRNTYRRLVGKEKLPAELKVLFEDLITTGRDIKTKFYYSDREMVERYIVGAQPDYQRMKDQGISDNSKTMISFDPSTICPKQKEFINYIKKQQKDLGLTYEDLANPEVIASLYDTALAEGVEVPCSYCYVEQGRRKALQYHYEGKATTGVNFAMAKQVFESVPYVDALLKFSKKKIADLNMRGGIRMFSFSDYVREYHRDQVQVFLDHAKEIGLSVKAITKNPEFVKDFGDRGITINMSIDADPSGQFGISWDKAAALKKKYPNAKVRSVAMNPGEVSYFLELKHKGIKDFVDVITPYHHDNASEPLPAGAVDMSTGKGAKQLNDILSKDPKAAKRVCCVLHKCFSEKHGAQCASNCGALAGEITVPAEITRRKKDRKFLKTISEAKEIDPDLREEVKQIKPADYFIEPNAESFSAARQKIDKEGVDTLMDHLKSDAPPSAEKGALFHEMIKDAQKVGDYDRAIELMELYDTQGREAGRFIQTASTWTKLLSPTGFIRWADKQLEKVEGKYGWADTILKRKPEDFKLSKEEQEAVFKKFAEIEKMDTELDRADATLDLIGLVADKVPPSVSELIDAYRYQNMLASPKTQMRNMGENILNTFITRPMDIATRGAIDFAIAPLSGKEREAYVKDAAVYLKVAINSVPNAGRAFVESFKMARGQTVGKPEIGIEASNEFGRARAANLPKALTVVGRFMEAADKFNMALIGSGEMAVQMGKGVPEAEAYAKGQELAEKYLYRDKLEAGDPSLSAMSHALNSLGKLIEQSRKLPGIGTLSKWYVPFLRTPINKAIQMVERSPLALARGEFSAESNAKILSGSVVVAMGALAAYMGETTWSPPTDKDEKELFYASGRKPYSVKLGNKWIPIWYLGPYAFAFGIPTAVKHYTEDESKAIVKGGIDKLLDIAQGSAQFIGSQSSTQSIGALFSAMHGDVDYSFSSQTSFTAQQIIPAGSLVRYINTIIDPVYRKPKGFIENIEKNLPVLSKNLNAHMTPYLEEATRDPVNYFLPYDVGTAVPEFEAQLPAVRYKARGKKVESAVRKVIRDLNDGNLSVEESMEKMMKLTTEPQIESLIQFGEEIEKQGE